MTIDELNEDFGFNESLEELKDRIGKGHHLHPVYVKWLEACWIIENIYNHRDAENISSGKARELTSMVIEKHLNEVLNPTP